MKEALDIKSLKYCISNLLQRLWFGFFVESAKCAQVILSWCQIWNGAQKDQLGWWLLGMGTWEI